MTITEYNELGTDEQRQLEYHLSKALDVVGLDHNYIDGLLDAVDDAVSIARED
jgi:hypothetical protein